LWSEIEARPMLPVEKKVKDDKIRNGSKEDGVATRIGA